MYTFTWGGSLHFPAQRPRSWFYWSVKLLLYSFLRIFYALKIHCLFRFHKAFSGNLSSNLNIYLTYGKLSIFQFLKKTVVRKSLNKIFAFKKIPHKRFWWKYNNCKLSCWIYIYKKDRSLASFRSYSRYYGYSNHISTYRYVAMETLNRPK